MAWGRYVEAQILQTVTSDNLGETRNFEVVKSRKMEEKAKSVAKTPEQMKKCGYCGSGHPHRQCQA